MKITADLLRKIKQTYKESDKTMSEEAYIAKVYNDILEIKELVKDYHRNREELRKKYEKDLMKLDKELKEVQRSCSHWSTKYTPDPSGGFDSDISCNICGASL